MKVDKIRGGGYNYVTLKCKKAFSRYGICKTIKECKAMRYGFIYFMAACFGVCFSAVAVTTILLFLFFLVGLISVVRKKRKD